MASDMITSQINHFNLTDIESAISALVASANANDQTACVSHFESLKVAINEIESLL